VAEYGLFARYPLGLEGRRYRAGERIPDEVEIRNQRVVERSVECGKIRRRPLTSAEVAQSIGDPVDPQVTVEAAARAAITDRQ
jgi:hypothetical protein